MESTISRKCVGRPSAEFALAKKRTTKSRIGKLRVVKINPTDAEARILEGAQLIRTGDRAYYYGP